MTQKGACSNDLIQALRDADLDNPSTLARYQHKDTVLRVFIIVFCLISVLSLGGSVLSDWYVDMGPRFDMATGIIGPLSFLAAFLTFGHFIFNVRSKSKPVEEDEYKHLPKKDALSDASKQYIDTVKSKGRNWLSRWELEMLLRIEESLEEPPDFRKKVMGS